MTTPPPISSSPDRLRYLAAMGIDVWIRRQPGDRASTASEEVPAHDRPASTEAVVTPPSGATGAGAGVEKGPEARDSGREESVRALPDAADDSKVVPPGAARDPVSDTEPSSDSDAESRAQPVGKSAVAPAVAAPVPRFRLRVLALGAGMLLVDEAAVEAAPRTSLQRLGDLLRAGCLLRGRATNARAESQTFFWPQLDVADVDQSLPRAVEALSAFVRRRSEAEGFFLILMQPATGLLDHDASEPLAALDALPVLRARVDAGFLTAPGPEADRAAWASLLRMIGAGGHDEVRRDD